MVSDQLERLKKDSDQLELFIQELKQQGDTDRMHKIIAKKAYLDNRRAEIGMT